MDSKLRVLPTSASQVLELKVCATTPSFSHNLEKKNSTQSDISFEKSYLMCSQDQLCEMENLRLESQQLREKNWLLQSQLDDVKRQKDSG